MTTAPARLRLAALARTLDGLQGLTRPLGAVSELTDLGAFIDGGSGLSFHLVSMTKHESFHQSYLAISRAPIGAFRRPDQDNVFIEPLWRSLKYEEVYLRDYRDLHDLERSLNRWFERYNTWRPHIMSSW